MFHLAAYYNSALGVVADTDIPVVTDGLLPVVNNHLLPQGPMSVLAAYAISPTLLRAKLSTPKLRAINPVYIRPIDFGAVLPTGNPNMDLKFHSQLKLNQLEEIQILATAAPGTTEKFTALLWLVNNFTPATLGDIYTVRWTSTATAGVRVWTQLAPIVYEQVLPWGTYSVLDSSHFSAGGFAHRLIFDDSTLRPGNLSLANNHLRTPYATQWGRYGQWGTFHTTNTPRVEVFCDTADVAHEGYIFCVRTGS